ncbi:hypothetical protein HRbin06_00879 [archaeon HR06]|nr:hypothetical protein HRbin06_00879 [archaeon HR06]
MPRTKVKAFRLDEDNYKLLKEIAELKGSTVSSLLEFLIKRFLEFEMLYEGIGIVMIAKPTLKKIVSICSKELLREIGYWVAKDSTLPLIKLVYGEVNLRNLIKMLEIQSKYCGQFNFTISNNSKIRVNFKTELGEKWGYYMQGWVEGLMNSLNIKDYNLEFSERYLLLTLPKECLT